MVSWKPVKTLVRGQLVVHLIWGCGAAQKRRQVWHLWKTSANAPQEQSVFFKVQPSVVTGGPPAVWAAFRFELFWAKRLNGVQQSCSPTLEDAQRACMRGNFALPSSLGGIAVPSFLAKIS